MTTLTTALASTALTAAVSLAVPRYKPHNIELETKMRPFIPDYIPAVGDIDPFVKVPRPDGKADNLGLDNLDEPAAIQSDPNVLQLQLRAVSKSSAAQVRALLRTLTPTLTPTLTLTAHRSPSP